MNFEEAEIRKTMAVIRPGLAEIRIVGEGFTSSGYFTDVEALINNLKRFSAREGINFYLVMNTINQACYSRQQKDCFVDRPKTTTSDKDIDGREWLMIDLDCERPAGVSSTNEELEKSKAKATKVYNYLKNNGFSDPVVALSGNGAHLLYKISLANDDASTKIVKECLLALDLLFSDKEVKIDTAVFNAARITKLYGTVAQKGKNTEDRPHRMSKIVMIPKEIKVNDIALLLTLAKVLPEPEKQTRRDREYEQFNLDDWLRDKGVRISQESSSGGARKLILEECPFNPEHKGKDAALFVMNNGAIGFKCLHSSCSNYTWQDVRKKYEPDAYNVKERITPRLNREKAQPEPVDSGEPSFYTATNIKAKSRDAIISIRTGIRELDKRIIGLNKGDVSCLSGVNSSGKSSLLSQIALEVVQKGYRAVIFSGELEESRVLNWLQLQAAGRQYTRPTQYEDYFTVPEDIKQHIDKWLDKSLFVYNNRKGNEIQQVLGRVAECILQNKVDFIILDNLMAMDLSNITGDKYEKQSGFIKSIKNFAREKDVHVVLVAHPRKTVGFLRKEDISGTADLTNVVDNVFIVHRVNNDFIRLSGQTFGWKDGYHLYDYSNVIEVCKNRDLGVQDLFVGLHYEIESKRFLNEKYEARHYSWEDELIPVPFEY